MARFGSGIQMTRAEVIQALRMRVEEIRNLIDLQDWWTVDATTSASYYELAQAERRIGELNSIVTDEDFNERTREIWSAINAAGGNSAEFPGIYEIYETTIQGLKDAKDYVGQKFDVLLPYAIALGVVLLLIVIIAL